MPETEQFPNSPLHVVRELVDLHRRQEVDQETYLGRLESFEANLVEWSERFNQNPPPQEYREGQELLEATQRALQLFADSVSWLRDLAATGEERCAEQALEVAAQGHSLMVELHRATGENIVTLENQIE